MFAKWFRARQNPKKSAEAIFEELEEQQSFLTETELRESFASILEIGQRMKRAGQVEGLLRLRFLAKVAIKEASLLERDITTFVWKRKLDELLDSAEAEVKMCEITEFARPLPEAGVRMIENTKALFTNYFVLFTDYTGQEDRRREAEARTTDPILFGAFVERDDKNHHTFFSERMYVLFSWKDDFCELSLDELLAFYENDTNLTGDLSLNLLGKDIERRLETCVGGLGTER